jgi:hypothetical protein
LEAAGKARFGTGIALMSDKGQVSAIGGAVEETPKKGDTHGTV